MKAKSKLLYTAVLFILSLLLFWLLLSCNLIWPDLPIPSQSIQAPAQYAYIDEHITVLIKTLNRREKVAALVASIERLYPKRLKILIGDDGELDEGPFYVRDEIVQANRIRYFWFGFDIGAGAGRNRLVS